MFTPSTPAPLSFVKLNSDPADYDGITFASRNELMRLVEGSMSLYGDDLDALESDDIVRELVDGIEEFWDESGTPIYPVRDVVARVGCATEELINNSSEYMTEFLDNDYILQTYAENMWECEEEFEDSFGSLSDFSSVIGAIRMAVYCWQERNFYSAVYDVLNDVEQKLNT